VRTTQTRTRSVMVHAVSLVAGLAAVGVIGLMPAQVSAATAASIMRIQTSATVQHGLLDAVSCLSARECTAVGAGTTGALAEKWNGKNWAVEATPPGDSQLFGVSCTSATACTAVGDVHPASGSAVDLTLAEHWNGKKWAVEATPNPAGRVDLASLEGVSCSSATACTAVGAVAMGTRTSPKPAFMMAEGWNGKKWVIERTPEPKGVVSSGLSRVSCSSATSCVAVGNYASSSLGGPFALVEGWNGKKWAFALPPNPKGTCTGGSKPGCTVDSEFLGVSCTSVKACTAVGQYVPFNGQHPYLASTLAERWNGKTWTIEPTPNPPPKGATANYLQLNTVSCTSAKACTAVGQYVNKDDVSQPVAESWNGKRWAIEPTPTTSTATTGSLLYGVSCSSPTQCAAVGYKKQLAHAGQ
jgi:uncharacterized membrane protein